jgi:hypothetical protein
VAALAFDQRSQIAFVRRRCGAMLRPKEADCCVFCSFGSVPCPPIQAERRGEGDGCSRCC